MNKKRKKDFLMDRKREFESFFKAHQSTLFRIIFGYIGQREIAEDLAVEAFIKIFVRWNRVRRMDNPTGYLVRSGINIAKTYLKKANRLKTVEIPETAASNPTDSPESIFFQNQQNRALEAELLKLNEKERNIILLKDISGHKFSDIADLLSIKLPTVKSIYRRAKIILAETLHSRAIGYRTSEKTDEPR